MFVIPIIIEWVSVSVLLLLISADQLGVSDNMTVHRLFQIRFGRPIQVGQNRIQRVELVKVAVISDLRAWSAITRTMPVVEPLAGALWKLRRRNTLG